jgi:RNA recognition motif-containing protein
VSQNLYIGNLPHQCTEQELRTFLATSGRTPESVSIVMDHGTGRSRGFGFAKMANDEDGALAIETLKGKELGGRAVRVGPAAKPHARALPPKSDYEDYGQSERPRGRRRR